MEVELFDITCTLTWIALTICAIYAINALEFQKHKSLVALVLFVFVVEMTASVVLSMGGRNAMIYVCCQIVELALVLKAVTMFFPSRRILIACITAFIIYAMLFILDGLLISNFEGMTGPANYVNGLVLLAISILAFGELFRAKSVSNILRFGGYFLLASIIIYRSTNFVVYLMFTPLMEATDYDIYAFQHIGSVFRYVLLIFAMKWNQNPMLQPTSLSSAR